MAATDTQAQAQGGGFVSLRVLALAHAALTILFGLLLLVVPGRTLTFVAVLAGISLCVMGFLDIARAMLRGLTGAQRAAYVGMAVLALAAGALVIARPEGSIKAVAVIAGIYLVVTGLARIVSGAPGLDRRLSIVRGALGLVAGVALLVWPDVSVAVLAAVYGVFLLTIGLAELVFGVMLGRARHGAA